jgi:repressor LexA
MNRPLTRRQHQVLEAIHQSQVESGISPTLEELGRSLGVNRTTVFGHVQALIQKGFLENLEPGASRGLDLTEEGHAILQPRGTGGEQNPTVLLPHRKSERNSIPLLGRIAAGVPIEAIETPEQKPIQELFPTQGDLYFLEVRGDSMIEDHIQDGDWVLVQRDRQPDPGSTVVAILENEEATLKRFYREKDGRIRLQPANAALEPLLVNQVEIRGVVVSVLRNFR